ncbi:MAG: isoprenylcysteine carboxylmethyltransferase family protein [Propionibacteriales bacterium]|nr:isoprenylcysteine carboxylmethyltransferase family protein [Propionibacteriales bacterium]
MNWRIANVPLPEPILLGIAAGVGLHRLRPWSLPGGRRVHHLVGWPLVALGAVLVARSVQEAAQVDLGQPESLVTGGPFARSRNPMYVGWALIHLGAGLTSGSTWIIATVPVVAGPMHREVVREERRLGEKFGPEFRRYLAAVPRY